MMESGNWQEWVTVWGYLGFTLLIMGCIWVAGLETGFKFLPKVS